MHYEQCLHQDLDMKYRINNNIAIEFAELEMAKYK